MKVISASILSILLTLACFGQPKPVQKNNEIAFKLFGEFSQKTPEGNFVLSPASVYATYGALNAAAAADTASAIKSATGFSASGTANGSQPNTVVDGFRKISETSEIKCADFRLFWIKEGIDSDQTVRDEMKSKFDAICVNVDFSKPAQAVAKMNTMLASASKNLVKDSVSPANVTEGSSFIVQNANYFSGKQDIGFGRAKTEKDTFTAANGKTVNVNMMNSDSVEYNFIETEGFKAFKLPYAGNKVSLVAIYPDKNLTPASALALLTPSKFVQMMKFLHASDCAAATLSMPRFKLDTPSVRMDGFLDKIKLGAVFDEAADFSKLSSSLKGKKIDAYLHKSAFAFEENGQTAPKAKPKTALFGIALRSYTINKPFAFMLVDNKTNAIYFIGCVADPSKS